MIRLISGVTRVGNRTYSPADGSIILDKGTEERLVSIGVARYIESGVDATERPASAALRVDSGVPYAEQGETLPDTESVTEGAGMPDAPPEPENDGAEAEREQADFYDRDYLASLTKAQLEEIADNMGIATSPMRRKAEFIEAILNQQAADNGEETESGETPPELAVEEPVS